MNDVLILMDPVLHGAHVCYRNGESSKTFKARA
jgi:hypothetical protein